MGEMGEACRCGGRYIGGEVWWEVYRRGGVVGGI